MAIGFFHYDKDFLGEMERKKRSAEVENY